MNALRAGVAILVVANHVRAVMFVDYRDAPHSAVAATLYALTSLGHPAVMVFFVLSGVWVGDSVRRRVRAGTFSWRRYGVQRLTRLWIVLLPVLALTGLVDRVGRAAFPTSSVYTAVSGTYSGAIVGNLDHHLSMLTLLANVAFVQGPRAQTYGTDSPLWSLGFEFWFYVLFPLLLIAFRRSTPLAPRVAALVAATAVVVLIGSPHGLVYFAVWLMGVMLAMTPMVPEFRGRAGVTVTAIVGLLAAMVPARAASIVGDLLLGAVAAVVLWLLRRDFRLHGAVWRAASYFGEWASYSLYLVHVPLVALIAAAAVVDVNRRLVLGPLTALAGIAVVALMIVAALALSAVTERRTPDARRWVESRLRGTAAHRL